MQSAQHWELFHWLVIVTQFPGDGRPERPWKRTLQQHSRSCPSVFIIHPHPLLLKSLFHNSLDVLFSWVSVIISKHNPKNKEIFAFWNVFPLALWRVNTRCFGRGKGNHIHAPTHTCARAACLAGGWPKFLLLSIQHGLVCRIRTSLQGH